MTPSEAIAHIRTAFPELDPKRSSTQTSFFLPERGLSGRVVRIAHSGSRPLKRAASSLNARHLGQTDGSRFDIALPATFDELNALVHDELKLSLSVEPTNWEKALRALTLLGGAATLAQITEQVVRNFPDFKDPDNVRKDLIMLSVNDEKRRAYRAHKTMRENGRSEKHLDRVYRGIGEGQALVYELYDPIKHGIWIGRVTDGSFRLERVDATPGDLVGLIEFDPAEVASSTKEMVARQVAARRGQSKFRKGLLAAYDAKCCISGCAIENLLEAAHITPHKDHATDVLDNGLLLRADLHTLFDLGLLRVHPQTLKVDLHPVVRADPDYVDFHDERIADAEGHNLSKKALQAHYDANAHRWLD